MNQDKQAILALTAEVERLKAAEAVCEAAMKLPMVLTTPDHKLTGRELLFQDVLKAWLALKPSEPGE